MNLMNNQIVLTSLPKGKLNTTNFNFKKTMLPVPKVGEVLGRTLYIAIDAASRAWMQADTYRPILRDNELMPGLALVEVMESQVGHLKPGDLIIAETGWQTYLTIPANKLVALPEIEPLTNLLSIFGVPGLTAYFGLLQCGLPKPGDTLVVSAAAGAVGSIVGQIGKIKGCTVVGIAGGVEKCNILVEQFGFDSVVNYKEGNIEENLRLTCPNGIDIYFDNVGGSILDAVLSNMANYGRIVCCGAISQYDQKKLDVGPIGIPGQIILKSLIMKGFLLFDFLHEQDRAIQDLEKWVKSGSIIVQEDIIDGFEKLPEALVGVLNGENVGKRIVKVANRNE
ncbi:NADP-dependent oxidoreductase [Chryseobacterium paludis]|uniref:NADP-dependent oxidoreductase n=1 Tax=Chryseobacterium paludis TaxID=2956784 RepID=UPI0021C194C8|nr:NADP-dependent oxidoreductase [Chryseobacterium paludis]